MARQIIDTTTDHGTYKGDPAQTAFLKVNDNFAETYTGVADAKAAAAAAQGTANNALPKTGGTINGQVRLTGTSGRLVLDDQSNNSLSWYNWVNNGSYYWVYQGSSVPASISYTGVVTATSFNPTSSADVKDYIEGYAGDASAELDRLAVISYRLKPDYVDVDKVFVGLLSENVRDVKPDLTDGEHTVVLERDGKEETVTTPLNYDLVQIVAISVRAHQQKNRRIKLLEDRLAALEALVGPQS